MQIFLPNVGLDMPHKAIPTAQSLNLDSFQNWNYTRGKMSNSGLYLIWHNPLQKLALQISFVFF